jgi:hypothetical protein
MGQFIDVTAHGRPGDLTRWQKDPIGFINVVLKERITPDVEEVCLSFRDYEKVVARSANATGKTHAAARLAFWFFLCFEESKVYTAAAPPEDNLKRVLWGEIGGLVERNRELLRGFTVSIAGMHIQRNPQSFLTGVTIPVSSNQKEIEAKFAGKHAPDLAFILDEGDAIPQGVYNGIESCTSGKHNRVFVMYNPRMKGGEPDRIESEGRGKVCHLSAFTHPNVVTGEDLFPGAVDRTITVRRINMWSRELAPGEVPDAECFEVPSFLVGVSVESHGGKAYPPLKKGYRRVTNPAFNYMVLGTFPAEGEDQLISLVWIQEAEQRWENYVSKHGPNPRRWGIRPVASLDVGEKGTDDSVLTFTYGGWTEEQIFWKGADPLVTGDRAAQECINRNALWCKVDSNGVGAAVAPQMRRKGFKKAYRIMVTNSAPEDEQPPIDEPQCDLVRDLMCWKLREKFRTDTSTMIPPSKMLREELVVPTYSTANPKGRIKIMTTEKMKEKLGRSPDRFMSLALKEAPRPEGDDEVQEESYIN